MTVVVQGIVEIRGGVVDGDGGDGVGAETCWVNLDGDVVRPWGDGDASLP